MIDGDIRIWPLMPRRYLLRISSSRYGLEGVPGEGSGEANRRGGYMRRWKAGPETRDASQARCDRCDRRLDLVSRSHRVYFDVERRHSYMIMTAAVLVEHRT